MTHFYFLPQIRTFCSASIIFLEFIFITYMSEALNFTFFFPLGITNCPRILHWLVCSFSYFAEPSMALMMYILCSYFIPSINLFSLFHYHKLKQILVFKFWDLQYCWNTVSGIQHSCISASHPP